MVSARAQVPSDQMLMALGAGTIHWSLVEAAIDGMVAMMFHRFGGNKFERDIPMMLGKKVKFLKRGFNRSPLLVDLKDEASTLLDQVTALSDKRNLLIHGAASEYWTDKIVFTKLRFTPQMQFVERHEVTGAEMLALAEGMLHIGLPLSLLVKRVSDWCTREHRGEPNSERPN